MTDDDERGSFFGCRLHYSNVHTRTILQAKCTTITFVRILRRPLVRVPFWQRRCCLSASPLLRCSHHDEPPTLSRELDPLVFLNLLVASSLSHLSIRLQE